MQHRVSKARGFTVGDLCSIVASVALTLACAVAASGGPRSESQREQDAFQLRAILFGAIIWANNNESRYPLPSVVDRANSTVALAGTRKDTTANIFSILLFNGMVDSPRTFVSAAEVNPRIQVDRDYQYVAPQAAIVPEQAQWDPAFAADFRAGIANSSYAHVQSSSGFRGYYWGDLFSATVPQFSNRGPRVSDLVREDADDMGPRSVFARVTYASLTFLIHGPKHTWEGNVGYSDGHTAFETSYTPAAVRYEDMRGTRIPDVLFYDEQDSRLGQNAYLGVWTRSGSTAAQYAGAWD